MRKTKIIATVGPACLKTSQLRSLILEGVDLFRVNASHTTPKKLREWILRIRKASVGVEKAISILVGLPYLQPKE